MRIVVLPGMDGGAALSSTFRALLPEHTVVGVEYPHDQCWGYPRLVEHVRDMLAGEDVVIVAESFSGPIAVQLAALDLPRLQGVVLVATFATPPAWPGLRFMVGAPLFSAPPPKFVVRRLLGPTTDEHMQRVTEVIARTSASVMSLRLRETLRVDVRSELSQITIPTLVIRAARDRVVPARRCISTHRPELPTVIDSPHLVLHAQPHRSAEVIREFVESIETLSRVEVNDDGRGRGR